MCGIVGYIGSRNATEVLIEGLSKLEYRGYDSAGVALAIGPDIKVVKAKGRLAVLKKKLRHRPHPVGYSRCPQRCEQPSAVLRAHQPGAQRHH